MEITKKYTTLSTRLDRNIEMRIIETARCLKVIFYVYYFTIFFNSFIYFVAPSATKIFINGFFKKIYIYIFNYICSGVRKASFMYFSFHGFYYNYYWNLFISSGTPNVAKIVKIDFYVWKFLLPILNKPYSKYGWYLSLREI